MYNLFLIFILGVTKYCSGITTCYTPYNVSNLGLVSYQNKVYNIDNYVHPGGQSTLLLSKGSPLESFFNEYPIHINNDLVIRHLQNIYVGELYDCCECGCIGNGTYPNDVQTTTSYLN